jgi:protein-S-isoprenylcysteine O-methyltransferase Ste14
LLIAVALAFAYDGTLPEGEVTVIRVLGAAVAFFGVVFAFIASRRLGGSMTPSPEPRPDGELVIMGPYRLVRHPIYGGLTLFMLGTALFLDSAVGFSAALLLIPFFLFKSAYEERRLRMRFAGYRAYMAVVTRRLIPFVV